MIARLIEILGWIAPFLGILLAIVIVGSLVFVR